MLLVEITAAIDAAGTLKTFYFGDQGYCTLPTDTPANTAFLDRLLEPGSIAINAFSNGRTGGGTKLSAGELVLNNLDGALDLLRNYSFDGRKIVVRSGRPGDPYPAGFTTVLNATGEAVEATWRKLTIRIRDKQYILERTHLVNRYLGTNALPNGIEGTASDIKGQVKPKVLGSVRNISPPCVNTSKLTYQVNDGAIVAIPAVYDRGALLTKGADYATNALLHAAAPAASSYITCLAEGLFRLGSTPVGQVTADATQGASAADRTAGQILKALALQSGVALADISSADVSVIDTLAPYELGLWLGDESTTQAFMDQVSNSVGGWYGFDGTGVYRLGRLTSPTGAAVLTLQAHQIKDGADLKPTKDLEIPPYQIVVNYGKIETVQTTSDLAGSVAVSRRAEVATEYRKATSYDLNIALQWLLSDKLEFNTLIVNSADADTEAARLFALYKIKRDVFEVPIDLSIFTQYNPTIMKVVAVQHPRFGMGNCKLFRVIGYNIELARKRATLTLWG